MNDKKKHRKETETKMKSKSKKNRKNEKKYNMKIIIPNNKIKGLQNDTNLTNLKKKNVKSLPFSKTIHYLKKTTNEKK